MKYEDLKILAELREKGSITEEEYEREKAKILNEEEKSDTQGGFKKPLFGLDEKSYLTLMHISQLAGFLAPLIGFIIPLIMWIANKEVNPKVDKHGKNIMNFIISFIVYTAILCITIIGIPLAIVVGILYIVFVIIAAVKVNNGEDWKYPLTIEFIK